MYIILSRPKATDKNAELRRLVAATFPKVHDTYEQAKEEAGRLASKELSKEFLIFQTQIGFRAETAPVSSFIPT